jgi:hypothetical protein
MDNRYWSLGCPPLMQDGRFITNYLRFNVVDQNVKQINNIQSAYDYRNFLQTHGDIILNNERNFLAKTNSCEVNGRCVPISGAGKQNVLPCGNCYSNTN